MLSSGQNRFAITSEANIDHRMDRKNSAGYAVRACGCDFKCEFTPCLYLPAWGITVGLRMLQLWPMLVPCCSLCRNNRVTSTVKCVRGVIFLMTITAQENDTMNCFNNYRFSWLASVWLGVCALTAQAQETLRPEILKSLKVAQDALADKRNAEALEQSQRVLALPQLSTYERHTVLRTLAVAAMGAQSWDAAISALEDLVQSSTTSSADKRLMYESLVRAALQKKESDRVARYARAYLQEGGLNASVRTVLIQSLNLLGRHTEVVETMQGFLQVDDASGNKTPEEELRALALSQRQIKSESGYRDALWRLLTSHEKPVYWAEYIARVFGMSGFNSRFELDLYRLYELTGHLQESGEYVEMAQLALKAGLPVEAVRVIAKGFEKGVLGQGSEASGHARLKTEAEKRMREDEAQFAQMEKVARDGNSLAMIAEVQFSRQNWEAANEAYAKALQLGGLRRLPEIQLHHAIGLLQAGRKDAARTQLQAIEGDATALELAKLWSLRAR